MANLNFAKNEVLEERRRVKPWKILIADDEHDVHTLTKTVLKDLKYNNRPLEFISTFTAKE